MTHDEMNAAELNRFRQLPPVEIQIAVDNWILGTATAWQRKIVFFEYERRLKGLRHEG